ncbi:transcriptional regulator, TetR family [Caloramator quimbayensis]|uniref:Transcriptional regulator, TetR family n=1 Tax=Caloramator quimbayensis TaxID=1147123 RepID=A0A1T4X6G3_9CLOT|nr:TetR-like C-terminal domain-containing protein [Caloramator quimbayensis]SKA84461.1 transcriptional regulator, TetR family [Caloramator quimbayensis]
MRSSKDDRRVKYTKMVLKESFIKLLSKKDITQITIKEICEDADINRATFYAHYNDQYDLMRKIENELLENISAYISEYARKDNHFNDVELIEKIFEYIKENAQLCKLLLSKKGDLDFQKRVMMLVYDKNLINLTNEGIFSKEYAEYIYSYTITGCVGIIQKWLEDGMDKSTRFMAEMIIKLTTYNTSK